jgi:hypothetical protein
LNIAAAVVGTVFGMLAGAASADDPKLADGKREEIAKLPPLAASVQAGFGMTTGNARSINLSGAGIVGYRFSPDERLVFG